MRYLIVIEQTETGYSAYAPDLPGCIATARTHEEIERDMTEAVGLHLDGLRNEGMEIPEPNILSFYVGIPQ
jgi:predicted RNase H-like HicB family nuclease